MAEMLGEVFLRARPDMSVFGSQLDKGATVAAKRGGEKAGKDFSDGAKRGSAGLSASLGAAFAGAAVITFFKGVISEGREAAKVGKQTEAVILSTGAAAGITAKHVADLSGRLSAMAGVDDELIQSGANVLLTFTSIRNEMGKGNDIFDQGVKVALDMSKALGTDMQGAVIQVGKALNDPIKGMSALRRVGVSFTQQQIDQVKAMVASGDTMGAQKLILAELNKEFAGSAKAMADPADKAMVAWGNFQEMIGAKLLPMLAKIFDFGVRNQGWLIPLVGVLAALAVVVGVVTVATKAWTAATVVASAAGWVNNAMHSSRISLFGTWIAVQAIALGQWIASTAATIASTVATGAHAVAMGAVKVATVAWTAVQWLLNAALAANPVGLVVLAIVALIAIVVLAYQRNETFRRIVQAVWAAIKVAIGATVDWFMNVVWPSLKRAYEQLSVVFKVWLSVATTVWRTIFTVIGAVVADIRARFKLLMDGVRAVGAAFGAGVAIASAAWAKLREAARAPVAFVINTVLGGLARNFNTIASKIPGLGIRLPIPKFSQGGRVPHPAGGPDPMAPPGDDQLAWVKTDEEIVPAGPAKRYRQLLKAITSGTLPSFSGGGTVGGPLDFIGGLIGAFRDPVKWFKDRLGLGRVDKFGSGGFMDLVKAVPRALADAAVRLIKEKFKALTSMLGGGSADLGGKPGSSIASILAVARQVQPNARVSSGYRPGDRGYHGQGLAADLIGGGAPGMRRMAAHFYSMSGRLLELIHTPGSYFVKNGRRVGGAYYASVLAGHYDHVHVAARRLFDRGGVLFPGLNLVENRLGRNETLVPAGNGLTIMPGAFVFNGVDASVVDTMTAALHEFAATLLSELRKGGRR